MEYEEKHYRIALSFVDLFGPVVSRAILNYCGSATAVFKEKKHVLTKVPGIGAERLKALRSADVLHRAEREVEYCDKNGIQLLFLEDPTYPRRLRNCPDAPILLYSKGETELNAAHMISVVGTRTPSRHGLLNTQTLIEEWAPFQPTIVSGLALGIDTCAHEACLDNQLPTVAVLGHGLDRIYPPNNRKLAERIIENQGCLLSEFPIKTKPDAPNFPRRNRIVAGMCDATIVIEAAAKGGALITGQLASSYQRDVFAMPGRITDAKSVGCLNLIRNNEANILTSSGDVSEMLGWEMGESPKEKQIALPVDLSTEEAQVISALGGNSLTVDEICTATGKPISQLFALLTSLEIRGLILALPGKKYEVI